jgi:hypothetical protein
MPLRQEQDTRAGAWIRGSPRQIRHRHTGRITHGLGDGSKLPWDGARGSRRTPGGLGEFSDCAAFTVIIGSAHFVVVVEYQDRSFGQFRPQELKHWSA